MDDTAESIKQRLFSMGVDMVRVVAVGDLVPTRPRRRMEELLPGARSVIVMAVAHSLGAALSPDIMLWTRNKMQTSRLLDQAAEDIGRRLERQGHLSLPVSADKPVEIFKKDPETGAALPHVRVAGHLSIKHAAQAAGMGVIGDNNLLLTPEFGPHQRLGAVLTTLELDPDDPRELDLCDHCGRCARACPSGALSSGGYNVDPCFDYWSYGFDRPPPGSVIEVPGYLRMLFRHARKRDTLVEMAQTMITDVDNCIECMRACPVGERWKGMRPPKMPPQKSGGTL